MNSNPILTFLHAILIIAVGVLLTIFGGVVFGSFWEWFVVPLGVADIGTAHAVGLMFLISFCFSGIMVKLNKLTEDDKFSFEKSWHQVINGFLIYGISWVFGWIVTLFM